MRIVELKKYKLLTYDLLRFVSNVLWRAWWRAWVIDDIMISVTKQMEAAEANICRRCLQNDNEELRVIHRAMAVAFRMVHDAGAAVITKNRVVAQLKRSAHFVQRNWQSPQSTWSLERISWFSATGYFPRKLWYCESELPLSFWHRLDAVVAAAGSHVDY